MSSAPRPSVSPARRATRSRGRPRSRGQPRVHPPLGQAGRDRRRPIRGADLRGALLVIVQPIWRSDDAWSPVGGRLIDAPAGIAAAIERLAAVRPGLRVFNAQRWGSWLELRAPSARYFADSRIELIPVVAWADYLDASSAAPGWPSILERWHVEVVAVSVIDQGPLTAALEADPGWRRIYADADGELFVRSPRPGHWPSLLAMPAVPTAAARPVIVLGPSTGWGES